MSERTIVLLSKEDATPQTPIRFATVSSERLSLWQSAVYEVTRKEISKRGTHAGGPAAEEVLRRPRMRATTAHALTAHLGNDFISLDALPHWLRADLNSQLLKDSRGVFERAESAYQEFERKNGRPPTEAEIDTLIRLFSNLDPGWLECAQVYLTYRIWYGSQTTWYRDWREAGKGQYDYSVVPYELPDDSRVALIGDWGTGMDDAQALLEEVLQEERLAAIIHLGDIYYSGTPSECSERYLQVFKRVFEKKQQARIPVFMIPGNHEYVAKGKGFFEVLDLLNSNFPQWRQDASYFCLRTKDHSWQLLAMDSGRNSSWTPAEPDSPWLQQSEIDWQLDKLEGFTGRTILLSHHQLFSATSYIGTAEVPYLNGNLYWPFRPYFDRVAAWFWGHEHNLVLYQAHLFNLAAGRLVGASAYEERLGDNPYSQRYPQVNFDRQHILGAIDGFYNHSYAVLDFKRSKASDPILVTYHQIPSWGGKERRVLPPGQSAIVTSEPLDAPGDTSRTSSILRIGQDRLELIAFGNDNGIYHRMCNGSEWSASGWEPLGGEGSGSPCSVSWEQNRVDIFVIGKHDGQLYHKCRDNSQWWPVGMEWEPLGGRCIGSPAAVSWEPNRIDVFVIGKYDRQMYHKVWSGSNWWPSQTAWEPLGGSFFGTPACVSWAPGRLDVFALGADWKIYHKSWDGSRWWPAKAGWESLHGQCAGSPSIVSWASNRLDLFIIGAYDQRLYHKVWDGTQWLPSASGWQDLGGSCLGRPAATSWGPGRLDVFVLGQFDQHMYHRSWEKDRWYPATWEDLGGQFSSSPTCVSGSVNTLDLIGRGSDRALYHKRWNGSQWNPGTTIWESLGNIQVSNKEAAASLSL